MVGRRTSSARVVGRLIVVLSAAEQSSAFRSFSAMHSSVRLRHMLSAFLRTCLSDTIELLAPAADAALDMGPG